MALWTSAIGAIALVLWIAMHVVERRRGAEVKAFTWAFVVLALFVVLSHHGGSIPRAFTGERVHTWNQFHYYLGSKYFGELGYFDLYAATLAADDDFVAAGGAPDEGLAHLRQTRDMHTYELVPRAEAVEAFDRSLISPERLAELGADARFLAALAGRDKSRRMLKDLGYNPAPPWTLLGTPLSNVVDLGGPLYPLVTASDVVALSLVFAALWWGFGLRTAAIATVWLHAMPINVGRMTGAFFTYDWLAAAAVAWACWERERPGWAGVALSWAAMTRVFPGLIAIPIVARVAWSLVRRQPLDPRRRAFAVAFCASCAVLLVASHGTGRGLQTWPEWVEKIRLHSDHHPRTGAERVGLGKLVQHSPRSSRFWHAARTPQQPLRDRQETIKTVATLLGLALCLVAVARSEDAEAMLLMLFAVWLLTTSSRYYASIWVLLFALPRAGPRLVGGTALLVMLAASYAAPNVGGRYLLLNYMALAMFVALCGVALARRARPEQPPRGI